MTVLDHAADLPAGDAPASYPSLRGRVALVTGGATGIGSAIVARLVQQGARVAFLDLDAAAAEALCAEVERRHGARPLFRACDLRDIEALRRAVADAGAALGPVEVLVNNAANDQRQAFADVTPAQFDEGIAVNARHHFFAAQSVAPQMVANGRGAIVLIGSHAWYLGAPGIPVYNMAKAAIAGLTRSLARELGPSGVRVNHVVPGWVLTQRQRALWWTPEKEQVRRTAQCLPDEIHADDVAQMVLFLASDAARMCTNQTFFVDGGRN